MSTPNQAYVSNAIPFGGITVEVFRNQANPASLGNYLVESISVAQGSIVGKRPGVDGGPNGFWIVNGDREGSITLQLAIDTTPSLENGDFFSASIRRDAAGAAVSERFVLHNLTRPVGMQEYGKQTGSVIVDQHVA